MSTVKDVENCLRMELSTLSLKELRKIATKMGVHQTSFKSKEELIEQCVKLELYAFTH